MGLLKKEKKEKLAFNLQNTQNQRALIKASLDNKIILDNKGYGIFIVDMKRAKNLEKFMKQFMSESINCQQGVIDKDDPKYNYIVIYDKEEN